MSHPMHLTKEDRETLLRMMAEMLLQRINFNPEDLMVISTATIAQFTGLSSKSVQRRFPITEISTQKQGVQLSTYREFLKKNTRPPKA